MDTAADIAPVTASQDCRVFLVEDDPAVSDSLEQLLRIKGFATTFRHMFKPTVTVNYPYEKVPVFPKFRGKQVLMRDENGLEKCVACGLCSVACPADAIYLEAAENDGSVQAGPRYAKVYQIHKTRCIFCGMCEEACPVSAIFMGKDYELAVYSKDDFIWDKTDLLVSASPTGRTLPGA